MIDRGALVVLTREGAAYRGAHRTPLDGAQFTGRKGKALGRRYTDAVIAGNGVLEDLDEAIELCREARSIGIACEVIVFEVPQTAYVPGALPVVDAPPAEGLSLLGWDVIEPIEPWDSPLTKSAELPAGLNANGLFATRREAESFAASANASEASDEPRVAARVWLSEV